MLIHLVVTVVVLLTVLVPALCILSRRRVPELAKCACCGGNPQHSFVASRAHRIGCPKCKTKAPLTMGQDFKTAADLWNCRNS